MPFGCLEIHFLAHFLKEMQAQELVYFRLLEIGLSLLSLGNFFMEEIVPSLAQPSVTYTAVSKKDVLKVVSTSQGSPDIIEIISANNACT